MAITDWPEDERPRERLIRQGAHTLSDAELLAIFLRVGVKGKSAVDLGREMLERFGSISHLFSARLSEFTSINGLGSAKFAQLQATLELARRALQEGLRTRDVLDSPAATKTYLQLKFNGLQHELFVILFLDVQNRLITDEVMFRGTLSEASVYPREVVKSALAHNAAGVILAHNHPSGSAKPSKMDHHLTRVLKQALALVDVRVLDHFLVAGADVYSFSENGDF